MLDTLQEIFQTVRKNVLRTILTAFSVAWGIFMLVLLLGIGKGLQEGVEYRFRDDANNSLWIWSGTVSRPHRGLSVGRRVQFTNGDYEAIKSSIPEAEYITGRYFIREEAIVSYKNTASVFDIRCTHPDHQYLENTKIVKGRFLNTIDIEQQRKVTVIGDLVAEVLFKNNENPIGQMIAVRGIPFKVVGIFADEGGEGERRKMYLPISTGQSVFGGANRVNMLMFTFGEEDIEKARRLKAETQKLLAERHAFAINDRRAVRIANRLEGIQSFRDLFQGINAFLWIVGIGTIVAGIMGISNIMLIAVKERTKEIGLRKAIGATSSSIVRMILTESILLTSFAGYVGLVLGVSVLELIDYIIHKEMPKSEIIQNPGIEMSVAFGAVVILVFAGTLAGLVPARRAARLQPVTALRSE
jgi:putative ABC transport system permease protein